MKLPVISKDTARSVSRSVDYYTDKPKEAFKEVLDELYKNNRVYLSVGAQYAKAAARDAKERQHIFTATLIAYKLLMSQAEANEMNKLFNLEATGDNESSSGPPVQGMEGGPG